MRTRPLRYALPLLSAALLGCSVVGELAYDIAAQEQRQQCDKIMSVTDRQACRQRVNDAERQAEDQRKKKD